MCFVGAVDVGNGSEAVGGQGFGSGDGQGVGGIDDDRKTDDWGVGDSDSEKTTGEEDLGGV